MGATPRQSLERNAHTATSFLHLLQNKGEPSLRVRFQSPKVVIYFGTNANFGTMTRISQKTNFQTARRAIYVGNVVRDGNLGRRTEQAGPSD